MLLPQDGLEPLVAVKQYLAGELTIAEAAVVLAKRADAFRAVMRSQTSPNEREVSNRTHELQDGFDPIPSLRLDPHAAPDPRLMALEQEVRRLLGFRPSGAAS